MSLHLLWESYSYLLLPVTGFLVFSSLALFSLFRGEKNSTHIYFACMCLLSALIKLDIALVTFLDDEELALRLDRLAYLFFVFVIPVYISFIHAVLGITKRRWIEMGAYLFSAILLPFTQSQYFISGLRGFSFGKIAEAGPLYYLFAGVGAIAAIYGIVTLVTGIGRAAENREKNRIGYVLIGFGLSGFLVLLNTIPIIGYDLYPMGNFNFIPGIILAFAVLRYDLLDMGILLRKGSAYLFLTGILTGVYALAIYLSNILFMGYGKGHPIAISLVFAVLVVALFNPARIRAQALVDRLFFRGKYDYQETLRRISGAMASFLRVEEIVNFLLESVPSALQTSAMSVALYREESGVLGVYASGQDRPGQIDSNTGQDGRSIAAFCEEYRGTLERFSVGRMDITDNQKERMLALFDATHAAILIPMIFQDRLMGIIAVGEKRSGELFVHEDMELLETIASQGAIAIENARNYQRLEEMNLNLEKKMHERTQALTAALEEKERTQRQLIQSESLASIGQLVAGTAHELNNPLASSSSLIQTCAETVEEWSGIDDVVREELVEDLRFSIRELDRAAGIVRSLLGLSRQTQTYVERVNVNILIDDALRVLRNRYKNTAITIERDLADDLPEIEGNFANLGQVAVNIINNAIQAQQEGKGTITLTTRHEEEANMVRVECRDTGKGMSPGEIRDAFKPFFTTKSPGEGTGLGLYIAHEIIQRHGGSIAIQSEPGRGATVSVALPCRRREEG